jgi:hypothetical protein
MPRDFFATRIEGIAYVPLRHNCGRCGTPIVPGVKAWWCGHVDRWCCHDCQTEEDWPVRHAEPPEPSAEENPGD